MAYAELADVRARAGKVGVAWDLNTTPGDPDIDRLLDNAAAEIDAYLASYGFGVPLSDAVATDALRSLNAAGALLKALGGTFPAEAATGQDVQALRKDVDKEWGDGLKALREGKHATVAYMLSLGGSPGATDFWTENPDYAQPWSPFVQPDLLNPYLAPTVARTDRF